MNTNHETTLKSALVLLARQQNIGLDELRLQAVLTQSMHAATAAERLVMICQGLDVPDAAIRNEPDAARLPSLCYSQNVGWAVIESLLPSGLWSISVEGTRVQASTEQLYTNVFELRLSQPSASQSPLSYGQGFSPTTFKEVFNRCLKSYKSPIFEGVFATLFIGFLTLGISLFSMQVYDRVIPTRSDSTLITLGIGVALAILLELGMKMARSKMMDSVIASLDSRVSREIFQRLMSVRIDQLPGSVGSLASQIRSYEQVRAFYTTTTLFTMVDLPLGLVILAVICAIATPLVAAVPLIFAALALAMGFVVRKRILQLAAQASAASNFKTGLLVEAVEGAETIKAGSGSWKFLSRWLDVNGQTIRNDMQMRHTTETLSYVSATLQQLSYAGLVATGAWVVMQGNMTMGTLIACSILSGRVMVPILSIPAIMSQHAHAQAASKSLEQLYALKTDNYGIAQPLVPTNLAGNFTIDKIKFAYPQSPVALNINRLTIHAGEHVGILGTIGAGKSTLLKILAGLYEPSEGRVLVDGLDIQQISRSVVSQHIGYLQQDHRLFQGTLRENLLIGLPNPGDDALKVAMTRSGLMRLISNHPKGLDLPIMEGGKGLSGGQRQLVAFTRLLLSDNPVWLLDEPTASMDDEQERRCLAVLQEECKKGKTLIVVTHKPSLLPLVNRLVIIAGSEIVKDGPRDAVLASLAPVRINPVASQQSQPTKPLQRALTVEIAGSANNSISTKSATIPIKNVQHHSEKASS